MKTGATMRIGIIGAGRMAGVLGARWSAAGHEVMIGARNAERGKALAGRLGETVHIGWYGQDPTRLAPRTRVIDAVKEVAEL